MLKHDKDASESNGTSIIFHDIAEEFKEEIKWYGTDSFNFCYLDE